MMDRGKIFLAKLPEGLMGAEDSYSEYVGPGRSLDCFWTVNPINMLRLTAPVASEARGSNSFTAAAHGRTGFDS